MKILICGGRDYTDKPRMALYLAQKHCTGGISEIIHGGARGADTMAGTLAKEMNIPVRVFPADWKTLGRSAGAIRNKQMLREGLPDLVVAFPGGHGTANMLAQARAAGVETLEPV